MLKINLNKKVLPVVLSFTMLSTSFANLPAIKASANSYIQTTKEDDNDEGWCSVGKPAKKSSKPQQGKKFSRPQQANKSSRPQQANKSSRPQQANKSSRPQQANKSSRPQQDKKSKGASPDIPDKFARDNMTIDEKINYFKNYIDTNYYTIKYTIKNGQIEKWWSCKTDLEKALWYMRNRTDYVAGKWNENGLLSQYMECVNERVHLLKHVFDNNSLKEKYYNSSSMVDQVKKSEFETILYKLRHGYLLEATGRLIKNDIHDLAVYFEGMISPKYSEIGKQQKLAGKCGYVTPDSLKASFISYIEVWLENELKDTGKQVDNAAKENQKYSSKKDQVKSNSIIHFMYALSPVCAIESDINDKINRLDTSKTGVYAQYPYADTGKAKQDVFRNFCNNLNSFPFSFNYTAGERAKNIFEHLKKSDFYKEYERNINEYRDKLKVPNEEQCKNLAWQRETTCLKNKYEEYLKNLKNERNFEKQIFKEFAKYGNTLVENKASDSKDKQSLTESDNFFIALNEFLKMEVTPLIGQVVKTKEQKETEIYVNKVKRDFTIFNKLKNSRANEDLNNILFHTDINKEAREAFSGLDKIKDYLSEESKESYKKSAHSKFSNLDSMERTLHAVLKAKKDDICRWLKEQGGTKEAFYVTVNLDENIKIVTTNTEKFIDKDCNFEKAVEHFEGQSVECCLVLIPEEDSIFGFTVLTFYPISVG